VNFVKLYGSILFITLQLTLLWYVPLHAQSSDFRFKNIFKEDGLSSNTIKGIVKDNLGFLWIATNSGLCRYDAKGRMKVFQKDIENNRLQSSNIQFIYNDSEGFLWIGTRHGGLTKIDVVTDTWTTYRHNPDDENSLANDEILCITEDREGRIWIGTESGLNIFYPKEERFLTFGADETDSTRLQAKAILSLLQDKKGRMWIGTWGGGLHLFLPDKDDIKKSTFRNFMIPGENAHKIVWEIYQDREGRYWMGEEFGLTYMQLPADASDEKNKQNWNLNFHKYQEKHKLKIRQVYSIIDDTSGNLWIGSTQGLDMIYRDFLPDTTVFLRNTPDKPELQIQNFSADKGNVFSISNNRIFYLYEDDQGLIWICTSKGLSQFSWRTRQFEFMQMDERSEGNASIITPEGILFAMDKSPYIYIYDLKKDSIARRFKLPENRIDKKGFINFKNNKDGTISMLTEYGIGVYDIKTNTFLHELIFDDAPQYFKNAFISAYMFYQNKIWVATSKGLSVFDTQLNEIKNYHQIPEDKQSLVNTALADIQFDNEGNLWISTWGGLSVMSEAQINQSKLPDKFKFENYEVNNTEGFISNKIVTLKNSPKRMYLGTDTGVMSYEYDSKKFIDRTKGEYRFWIHNIYDWTENDIWMSTEEGIVNYNAQTEDYKIYYSDYGINHVSLRYSISYKDEDERLYFIGENMIIRLAPDKLLKNETPPEIFVTDVRILNTEQEESFSTINTEEIELQYGDYLLALSFAALNYDSPEKNQYKYKLEGFSDKWEYTTSIEPVVYTNLDAGNYTFTVKAANNDGVWNDKGRSLKIIKKPAYWETRIFKVIAILILVLAVLWGFRIYNKTLRKRYKEIASYNKKLNTEIRERKKAETSLQEKNTELISINRDLEQFAYICSHDLKEPISGIYSFSHLIERKIEHEATKKKITPYLKYVYNYVQTLQNIISSLGIFTEINKREKPTPIPLHVSDIYKKVENNLEELINDKNAVLHFNNSAGSDTICSSEYELILVLQNLVYNGIKHNTSKVPSVCVDMNKEEQAWLFTIKDNGIGVEEQYHEYIFKPFKTLENKNKNNSSGLGLAICAKIINRLGGKIWVESELNKGSTFYVLLEKQTPNE